MHANVQWRHDPTTGEEAPYYRLKESYRDVRGTVHSLIVLNIGFEPALVPRQMHRIAAALTSRFAHRHQKDAFGGPLEGLDPSERDYAERYWRQMIADGQIDRFDNREEQARQEAGKYIDLDTVRHTDAREVGAEWLCKQAIDQLGLEEFLRGRKWTKLQTDTALSHLIVRTVYAPSELATLRIMADNSAACELYSGLPGWVPGVNSLYGVGDRLLELKDELERHLCSVTDDLFNQKNRIVLFDLTNFYFEGSKRGSKKAKFGRCKSRRYDCKLLVLALCVNTIRHQLKGKGENAYWTEIVRRMSTQKLVNTTAFNALGEKVELRQCSEPTAEAAAIYDKLGYRRHPFRKTKSVLPRREPAKTQLTDYRGRRRRRGESWVEESLANAIKKPASIC